MRGTTIKSNEIINFPEVRLLINWIGNLEPDFIFILIFFIKEVERPPAPLPDEGASTAEVQQEQEEQTLNIIMEDSSESVTLPEFDTGSRRSSTARPDNLTTREY